MLFFQTGTHGNDLWMIFNGRITMQYTSAHNAYCFNAFIMTQCGSTDFYLFILTQNQWDFLIDCSMCTLVTLQLQKQLQAIKSFHSS